MENESSLQDFITNLPPEILEPILCQISGKDLSRLKQSTKIFYKSLDNAIAWRSIFNERFKKRLNKIKYIDDTSINWREEVNRIVKLEKSTRKSKLPKTKLCSSPLSYNKKGVYVHNNSLLVDGYAPLNIKTCLNKKSFNFIPKYPGHIIIGPYAGQIEADNWGGHQIVDLLSEEIPFVYKKIFQRSKNSKLIAFGGHLAVLEHDNHASIWNLSIICKHTEERLWKKSKNPGNCEECAYLCSIDQEPGIYCSRVDPKMILVPTATYLQVRWPIAGRSIEIQFDDTCQIYVDDCPPWKHPIYPESRYEDFAKIKSEQTINIDGELHHIIHSVVDKQHRFYDLTTQKLMAVIDCWFFDKWIPNTCYFAMATKSEVVVLDIHHKRVVSQFAPKIPRTYRGKEVEDCIYALEASRYSPVLFVSMNAPVICSAFTGAQFEVFGFYGASNIALTEDEKTLISWTDWHINFWDLKVALSCLRK